MSRTLPAIRKQALPALPLPSLGAAGVPDRPPVRSYMLAGGVALLVSFGGFGSWATLAPLSSAAIAPGAVQVDSNRKTIQHLEGGIIGAILVREGERVAIGQVLVRMDEVAARADRDLLRARLLAAAAEEARLIAERDGAEELAFIVEGDQDATLQRILDEQRDIFNRRRATLQSEITVFERRIDQQRAITASAARQIQSIERQSELVSQELDGARQLLEKGLERRPRVLELERRIAALEADRTEVEGRLGAAREAMAEAEAQIHSLRSRRADEISSALAEARSRRAEAEEQERKAADRLRRLDVVAPQDGIVLGLKYFSSGAVVPPGGELLDLVPDDDALAIDVRVNPIDIDVVHEGLPAQVRLVAFKQRVTPTVQGRVTRVSADALLDQSTGLHYYLARVELDAEELARIPGATLYPGMPAEALILTGERTFLDYLLRPILDSLAHAFREQ